MYVIDRDGITPTHVHSVLFRQHPSQTASLRRSLPNLAVPLDPWEDRAIRMEILYPCNKSLKSLQLALQIALINSYVAPLFGPESSFRNGQWPTHFNPSDSIPAEHHATHQALTCLVIIYTAAQIRMMLYKAQSMTRF